MTPDQLKDYVDIALKQRESANVIYFILVPVLSLLGGWLGSYLTEKGKNSATKEDVGRITTEIESSRAQFSERLEKVRFELSAKGYFSKLRYEREMKVFEELWPKLCSLRVAVLNLRPVMDTRLKPGETEEDRKKERTERFGDVYMKFAEAVEHSRPFYPPVIWQELKKLMKLCWGEAVDFRLKDQWREKNYWDVAMDNSKAINEQVDTICEAIRTRLTAFDDA